MNAGGGHTGDGLRRTASSLVVALGKERVRAQRAGQCCHCASIQLLPGLQGRRGTPWEAVSATNTLAPAPPMHKKCYGLKNATPRRCLCDRFGRRTDENEAVGSHVLQTRNSRYFPLSTMNCPRGGSYMASVPTCTPPSQNVGDMH